MLSILITVTNLANIFSVCALVKPTNIMDSPRRNSTNRIEWIYPEQYSRIVLTDSTVDSTRSPTNIMDSPRRKSTNRIEWINLSWAVFTNSMNDYLPVDSTRSPSNIMDCYPRTNSTNRIEWIYPEQYSRIPVVVIILVWYHLLLSSNVRIVRQGLTPVGWTTSKFCRVLKIYLLNMDL